ncbi:hypothetical protein KC614_03365, partial [candidate division WWE3 bacterium]|nr:hypothetical protein [candidate division WWE3 bacterium]
MDKILKRSRAQRFKQAIAGSLLLFVVSVVGVAVYVVFTPSSSHLKQVGYVLGTTTSQDEWQAGEYYPGTIDTTSTPGDISINPGAGLTWDGDTPGFFTEEDGYGLFTYDQVSYGADLATDGYYIYMITGNRRPYLFRYNPELNTFKKLQNAPTSFYYGGAIAYYQGALYAIDGGEQNENGDAGKRLYKYDIATNVWSRLADAPDVWGQGSDIVAADNGKLYAVQGISTAFLWSYDVAANTWDDALPNIPSYQVYTSNSHALEFVDESYGAPTTCTEGCLFAFRGNGNRDFFRFDIYDNQWYTATSIPVYTGNDGRVHYGSSMAYDPTSGDLYALTGYNNDEFVRYDVSAETWDASSGDTPDAPDTVYYGGAIVRVGDYMYALRGNNTNEFWRYDLLNEEWGSISTPASMGTNAEDDLMVHVNNGVTAGCTDSDGCLFIARGSNTATFWRYDIGAKTWATLTNISASVQQGASMCYNGADYIYVTRGSNTVNFYRYVISTDTWSSMANVPTTHSGGGATGSANVRYGASLSCIGTTAYLMKGNNSNHFYSFDGSSWSEETLTPYQTYYGSGTANDGTDIFALMGYWRSEFYKYDTTAKTWTAMDSLPTGSYYNGNLIYDGSGYIYAISGDYRDYFWRYDIANDVWMRSSNFPERTNGYNASLAIDTANNKIFATRGFNTQSVYTATYTTDEYIDSATWISDTIDLQYVNSFTSFASTDSTPGTTSIDYYTRTSNDGAQWDSWVAVSGSTIGSSAKRYIQIKIVLNSDGTNTPVVSDVTINYSQDTNPPTNPTATGYDSSLMGTSLTSGNTYYYTRPYFELSGASDGESEVAGYYVLWTTNASGDPAGSEDYYQTGTTYEVNSTLTGSTTYYLRVKTEDSTGNVSSAATVFTYVYGGVASATTASWTVQADFEATGTSSTNINTAAGSGTNLTLSSVSSDGIWMDLPSTYGSADLQDAYQGTSMTFDGGDYIYVLRADNSKSFYRYQISTKTWSSLTDIASTGNARYGATLEYVTGASYCQTNGSDGTGTTECIYAFVGNATQEFLRYDVDGSDAGSWTALTDFSNTEHYGSSLAWAGGSYIYALRSYNSTEFYRYNIATNTWAART